MKIKKLLRRKYITVCGSSWVVFGYCVGIQKIINKIWWNKWVNTCILINVLQKQSYDNVIIG